MKFKEVSPDRLIQGKHYWVRIPRTIDRVYWADLDLKKQVMRLRGFRGNRDIEVSDLPKGTRIFGPIPEVMHG